MRQDDPQVERSGVAAVFWLRYLLILAIAVGLCAAAVWGLARSAWGAGPLAPRATLVAWDAFGQPDKPLRVFARLVPPTLSHQPLRLERDVIRTDEAVTLPADAGATVRPAAATLRFRLSPEAGLGPLSAECTAYTVQPADRFALVDLEGLRAVGRYDLEAGRREWLASRLGGRRPIYVADVQPGDYPALRAELRRLGWPDGPLLCWRWTAAGRPVSPERQVAGIGRILAERFDLAILDRDGDNQPVVNLLSQRLGQRTFWPPADRQAEK